MRHRNPWKLFVFSWLTIGFYALGWYYRINKEMRDRFGLSVNPRRALLAVSLGALVVVPGLVSAYRTAERVRLLQELAGVERRIDPRVALFLSWTGFYGFYVQRNINRLPAPGS
jgi:hypothetical protein